MKKKVYIVRKRAEKSESEPWIEWLKQELKEEFEVVDFDMPDTESPEVEEWVDRLKESVGEIDENTYFIGHSVGCQAIMRFLEKLHKHRKIGGCVFVAGFFDLIKNSPEELRIAHPWTDEKINLDRVLDHCDKFLTIFSRDDPNVPIEESEKFKDRLAAEISIKENEGHFESTEKIPEIPKFLRKTH